MKKILSILILISPFLLFSQKQETLNSITNNSIEIEDANPNSELNIFEQNTPGYNGSNCASDFGRLVPGISV